MSNDFKFMKELCISLQLQTFSFLILLTFVYHLQNFIPKLRFIMSDERPSHTLTLKHLLLKMN